MRSFYELPDGSADDDAEALKKAFRDAVKANHPDLHPDDPEAPERFRQVIAANALLRDTTERARHRRLLQLERQHRLDFARRRLKSQRQPRQLRSKMMRTAVAVAAVTTLIGGYLSARMSQVTVGIDAATGGVTVRQAATLAEAHENENSLVPTAPAKPDTVKGRSAGDPVETAVAALMQPPNPIDRGELPGRDAEIAHDVIKPSATASETNSGDAPDIAGRELAPSPLSNDANFYRERGIALYRSGDVAQAIINLNAAIRLDPNDAQAYNIRGNAWDEMGVFTLALADYDEAIGIDPRNPAVFHDRAILWRGKGEPDKALADLDRAIRFGFSDANMYCDRGLIWYEKGRHDRAVADFNQAIKLDPSFAAACIRRGVIVHRNSEFKLALAAVNQAIRVDPSIFDALRRPNLPP